ncbi:OmpA family protein [Falsiroseomonas selenitidurans]|uniref:OmpA family protein n=1 Tax=Falsiroseomonas selenitidurans TaxID=2716335 RepID=A0ABX1E5N2_9PROT|nr:OmpA family protein [Falsiroseomonas selenitidurans]NKC32495.1 OmpA family protein [Falsiroseomonas selenitidurans]
MSLRNVLLAATVLALPVVAQAQPISGLYVGAGAGVNLRQESDATLSNNMTAPRTGTAEFNYGFVGVLSLGYGFGNGVRAEIEGSYRNNEVDDVSGFGLPNNARSLGSATTYGVMANALYDFDLGPGSFLTPYVGAGAGYQWVDNDVRGGVGSGNTVRIDGTDGRFAYQAIVGAAFPIAQVPGLAVTAEYRFLGTLDNEVDARRDNSAAGTAEQDNFNHSLLIGLRYAFGVTPPPPVVAPVAPAPAAAPAIARTYLVFFDFDRADLTDRARQIIAEAATNSQRAGTTRIEVSGHADRSGTPQYNQRLSERRAAAVAAELERRGVPRAAMAIQAFGESRPLVPTADGVREPQNRRVEIVLR